MDRGLVFFTLYAWARPDREPEGDPGERQAKDAWRCATTKLNHEPEVDPREGRTNDARRVWTHQGGPGRIFV